MRRILFLLFMLYSPLLSAQRPAVTIVCVVDQLAEHLLTRHRPFLSGGLKKVLEHGAFFSNAYHPHALPATATGHAGISTGALPHVHGIIANEWYKNSRLVKACDDKDYESAGVFNSKKAKSARSLRAPTLADSCITDDEPFTCISLSLKSRAAITMAGQYGTALWFDSGRGQFTSSKAFGPRLPAWARAMNKHLEKTLHKQKTTSWQSVFGHNHKAYQHARQDRYLYTGHPFKLVNTPQPMNSGRKPFFLYQQTPQSSKTLFDLARLAIRMSRRKTEQPILLCLSLSSLDYVGHYYGPNSREMIDMVYQIDKQLGQFINKIEQEYGPNECVWAVTADHGVMPIPEREYERGRHNAQRLDAAALIKDLNHALYATFNVKNLIFEVLASNIYVNQAKWDSVPDEQHKDIIRFVKSYLTAITGITHAWHATDFGRDDFMKKYGVVGREYWFQNQYYPGRSGDFVIHVDPYTYVTSYEKGTSHESPYDYDTRVPLALYAPGRIAAGVHTQRASLLQLPTTLATLLNVSPPARAHKISLLTK